MTENKLLDITSEMDLVPIVLLLGDDEINGSNPDNKGEKIINFYNQ